MTNSPMNLDEPVELAGIWWLPDKPDEKLPGILRYDGKGAISLSLIGAFEDRIVSHPSPGVTEYYAGTKTWNAIHGVADRSEVTLLDCVPIRSQRIVAARVKGPDTQLIRATLAVIGAHISGEEDPVFAAAEVSIDDLAIWAASSEFVTSLSADNDGKFGGVDSISVKPVEAQVVTVDTTEYSLLHIRPWPSIDFYKGGAIGRMKDTVRIRIHRSELLTLRAALEEASLLQDLIALATHSSAGVIWLQLEIAGTETTLPDGQCLPCRGASVLYSPVALGRCDEKSTGQVFFTCKDLPFEEILPCWCEAHDRLQAATNMILGLRYAPGRFIESNLLTAVGAAEVLHRGLNIDKKPFPKAKFREMRDAMLSQVPEEYRDRFKEALRNSPTLRDRLLALASRPDQYAIRQLVPDVNQWAERTTKARNNLVHNGRTPNQSIDELNVIVQATTAVVILNILHELGLSADRQCQIVQDHPQLREVCKKTSEWLNRPDGYC